MWFRGFLLGSAVLDRHGLPVGRVEATYPYDGSDPEFAVMRVGRFGDRTFVPLQSARTVDGVVQVPYSREDIQDAPTLDRARYEDDAAMDARTYWGTHRAEYGLFDFEAIAALRDR
jgi:hypothetical protein